MESAIKCGYRHIDGAWTYKNEHEIGNALQKLFKAGAVKREDVFVVTKVRILEIRSLLYMLGYLISVISLN